MTWWRVQQVDPDVIRQVRAAPDAHEHNLVVLMVYAFMAYGAPPHRIEEYAHQLIKACRLEGRAKYTVGCTELCVSFRANLLSPCPSSVTRLGPYIADFLSLSVSFHSSSVPHTQA